MKNKNAFFLISCCAVIATSFIACDDNNNNNNNNAVVKCEVGDVATCEGNKINFCHPVSKVKVAGDCTACASEKNVITCGNHANFLQNTPEKKYEIKALLEKKKEQYLAINTAHDKNAENHFKAFREQIDVALDFKVIEEGMIPKEISEFFDEKMLDNIREMIGQYIRYTAARYIGTLNPASVVDFKKEEISADKSKVKFTFQYKDKQGEDESIDSEVTVDLQIAEKMWIINDIWIDGASLKAEALKALMSENSGLPYTSPLLKAADYYINVVYYSLKTIKNYRMDRSGVSFEDEAWEKRWEEIDKQAEDEFVSKGYLARDSKVSEIALTFDTASKSIKVYPFFDKSLRDEVQEVKNKIYFTLKGATCKTEAGRIDCGGETVGKSGEEAKCEQFSNPKIVEKNKIEYCAYYYFESVKFGSKFIFHCPNAQINKKDGYYIAKCDDKEVELYSMGKDSIIDTFR